MLEGKELKFQDVTGKNYQLGDIVFNPFFGDYWVVKKYSRKEIKTGYVSCPYCLALYGDKDFCTVDLDEPAGFRIVCSKKDSNYKEYIKTLKKFVKEMEKNYE